ncbi:Transcriptional regulator of nonfermentable carbon utilization [Tulasnella sp. 403]|nr:Transcriptional regulator of nonfermentable carbon utilization [Tulasnella sp. 403]
MLLEQVPVLHTPSSGASALNGTRNGKGGPASSVTHERAGRESSTSDITLSDVPGPSTKKQSSAAAKRKRASMSTTPTDDDPTSATTAAPAKEKKKKASQGHRKKAKYLLDEDELEALKQAKEHGKPAETPSATFNPSPSHPPQSDDGTQPLPSSSSAFMPSPLFSQDPLYNINFDHPYSFDSTAANMEYSMLSAILGNPSHHDDANAIPPSPPPSTTMINPAWPSVPLDSTPFNFANGITRITPMDITSTTASSSFLDGSQVAGSGANPSALQFRLGDNALGPLTPPASDPTPASPALANLSPEIQTRQFPSVQPQTMTLSQRAARVYNSVNQPFDYVDGYHFLMQYLKKGFEKMDILRIVRALAIFRPSLIALQMDLSPEDEVFAEKCFQRTLIELEKLISFSGTPTVVWRRTGEICLVGVEFTMLTEWPQDELVKKRKFIYELFENQSVVEYWEKFASHAFESSSQSVNCHCVLLKPSGEPIPCAFCFSIRRDVFDLPNVVIGQWLPLL